MTTAICRGTSESQHKKTKVSLIHGIGRCPVCGITLLVPTKQKSAPAPRPQDAEAEPEKKPSRMSFEPYPDNDWAS